LLVWLLGVGVSSSQATGFSVLENDSVKVLKPLPEHPRETILITQLLDQIHFRKTELDDSLGSVVLDEYIKSYDPFKLYFLKKDINDFDKYRSKLDNHLRSGNLEAAYYIYERFQTRFSTRMEHLTNILSAEINFEVDEYLETDTEKINWSEDDEDLDEHWRKMIKYQVLGQMLIGKEQGEAISDVRKRYNRTYQYYSQFNSEDVYQVFMNSLTESYDPHTSYFSPKTAEDFQINMSLSLEGIGAQLSQEGDYTTIVNVIAGGPAFKSGEIHKQDRIIGVAQGTDGEYIDVVGWRTDEVVQHIRGPKGTTVRLKMLKAEDGANALPEEVILVRDKIKLEEQSASSEIIPVHKDGKDLKMGVIDLPSFYIDFEAARNGDPNYRSTTRDVRKLLEEFNEQDVDGVLIDLRRNGGGSLQEAIELTGLFIEDGPVVQVKNSLGKVDTGEDEDKGVVWNGPLTVLINRYSASASEIFAGAIQDYQRGVVIGEQTYGKGTVQNLIPLDRYMPGEDAKLGELKITIAKYYRVTGQSTQHKGVVPDINMPSAYDPELFGESSIPSALPWDEIQASKFEKSSYVSEETLQKLKKSFNSRLDSDPALKELEYDVESARKIRNETLVSLQESKRRQDIKEAEERKNKAELAGKITTTESGDYSFGEAEMKDSYLKQGIIVLAELIGSVG